MHHKITQNAVKIINYLIEICFMLFLFYAFYLLMPFFYFSVTEPQQAHASVSNPETQAHASMSNPETQVHASMSNPLDFTAMLEMDQAET